MEPDGCAQVDVGEGIAADDEERFVQVFLGILDAAGGSQRRVLHDVGDLHAEVGAVAEIVADSGAQVLERHHHLGDPVFAQQGQDVLHHRFADHGDQRLGAAAREWP